MSSYLESLQLKIEFGLKKIMDFVTGVLLVVEIKKY